MYRAKPNTAIAERSEGRAECRSAASTPREGERQRSLLVLSTEQQGAVRTGDASGLMPAAAGLAASAAALTVLVRARKRR